MPNYIALQAIQIGRKSIEPRGLTPSKKGSSGLFDPKDYGLTTKQIKNLVERGAIRETEDTEDYEKAARIEEIETRVIEGAATVVPTPVADPLDLDKTGGKGGSIDELDGMTVPALKALAETETIDLGEAKKSPDIKKAIRDARAAKAAAAAAAAGDGDDDDDDELLEDE